MSITRYQDIPRFPQAGYSVRVPWYRIEHEIGDMKPAINLRPDFQREDRWTREQQIAFVEHGLMGGESSMVITSNCPGVGKDWLGEYVLVDGLQRVTSVRAFIAGKIPAFGSYVHQFTDAPRTMQGRFEWRILGLQTRAQVLKQYLLMNEGGVVHSREEIERVKVLLAKEDL